MESAGTRSGSFYFSSSPPFLGFISPSLFYSFFLGMNHLLTDFASLVFPSFLRIRLAFAPRANHKNRGKYFFSVCPLFPLEFRSVSSLAPRVDISGREQSPWLSAGIDVFQLHKIGCPARILSLLFLFFSFSLFQYDGAPRSCGAAYVGKDSGKEEARLPLYR